MARAKENNYILPQARAMEWLLNEGRGFYARQDDKNYMTYITPDGCSLYGIPTDSFLLDKDRIRKAMNIGGITLEKGAEKVTDTGKIIDEGRRKLRIFELPNGETVHINERFYQDFQKVYGKWFQKGELVAYAQGPNAPLQFVRNDVVIGFILPVRH